MVGNMARQIVDQDQHEAFEKLVGGPIPAFNLLRMWCDMQEPSAWDKAFNRHYIPKRQQFTIKARRQGYTQQQIEAFLDLQ